MTHPVLVDPDWTAAEPLAGSDHQLLTYADGTVRFRHLCVRPAVSVVCAPALRLGDGHTLTRGPDGAPTVVASVLCDQCGTHGWVAGGAWVPA